MQKDSKNKMEENKTKQKLKLQTALNGPSHPCNRRGGLQSGSKHVGSMSAVFKVTVFRENDTIALITGLLPVPSRGRIVHELLLLHVSLLRGAEAYI